MTFLTSILNNFKDFHEYILEIKTIITQTRKKTTKNNNKLYFSFYLYATIRNKDTAYFLYFFLYYIYLFIQLLFMHHAFLKLVYVRIINEGYHILHCYCSLNSLLICVFRH